MRIRIIAIRVIFIGQFMFLDQFNYRLTSKLLQLFTKRGERYIGTYMLFDS